MVGLVLAAVGRAMLGVTTSAAVGGLIAAHRPADLVGYLMLASASCFAVTILVGEYGRYALVTDSGSLPVAAAMVWVAAWLGGPGSVPVLVLVPCTSPTATWSHPRGPGRLVHRGAGPPLSPYRPRFEPGEIADLARQAGLADAPDPA